MARRRRAKRSRSYKRYRAKNIGIFFSDESSREERTEDDSLSMARTQALLSAVSVLIVSVRPRSKSLVSTVSYVAVNVPLDLYHASWSAIWMYASGESRAIITPHREMMWHQQR